MVNKPQATACYYCGAALAPLQTTYLVRAVAAPPNTPFRHMTVGRACERCIDIEDRPTTINTGAYNG